MQHTNWETISNFFHLKVWLVQIIIYVFIGIVISGLESIFYNRLRPRLVKTAHTWDDTFLQALRLPLQFYIWVLVVSLVLPILLREMGVATSLVTYLSLSRQILFVFAVTWFILRYSRLIEQRILQHHRAQHTIQRHSSSIRSIAQLTRIAIVILALLTTAQTIGFNISSMLAFGGIGALAFSFAAKDTLANFFGGLMIFWDRPFTVGDWIRSPDRNIEGTVEHIGWRLTRIRTFDKRPLYVPNGIFSTISVENPSRMHNRRIKTTIGLRYQDAPKISVILSDIETMLRNHPEIDAQQTLMVNLFEFGSSALQFFVYTFTKTTDWVKFQAIQQDVFLKIIDIIIAHGAECAFPCSTVYVPEGITIQQQINKENSGS